MHVVFTGGGSAGHVTPNVALIEAALDRGWQVDYVGSRHSIERDIIGQLPVTFHHIASGKLRRYFSWENFIDPFRVIWGTLQSLLLVLRLGPDVVFSKGGFVSVPIVVAAWLLRVPVISHESDVTPGLANRLVFPFCRRVCLTFDATRQYLKPGKLTVTGTPVRKALLAGDPERGRTFLDIADRQPILLVFGGSLGANVLNRQLRRVIGELTQMFNVVHVTGAGQLDESANQPGYIQKEYIADEFGDVLAAADMVVSRAGANSLYELFVLQKPHLLVPLTTAASRGDQVVNARTFEALGFSTVLPEEKLSDEVFLAAIVDVYSRREAIASALRGFVTRESVNLILYEIQSALPAEKEMT